MPEDSLGHLQKVPLSALSENVVAEPRVPYLDSELEEILHSVYEAAEKKTYYPQISTPENPALSDDYIFDSNDQNLILMDLQKENFVGKIKDLSKGAKKRRKKGYPDEYLYVFKYGCKLTKLASNTGEPEKENVLIYIKINDRIVPYRALIVVSFHKNKCKNV